MRGTPRTRALALSTLALTLGAALFSGDATAATPGDSLSVPMFGDRSEALWPLKIGLEVRSVESGKIVVPRRELVVADGQHTTFSAAVATPRGRRVFDVELVARHHAGEKIELEYDLDVRQARFAELTWSDYLLHRVGLGPRPALGPDALAAVRADIVETATEVHSQRFSVDGDVYEIRLYAKSMRG